MRSETCLAPRCPALFWSLLLLAAACSSTADNTAAPSNAIISERAPDWQSSRSVLAADGAAETVTFNLSPGSRAFALRARASGAYRVMPCYALDDVVVNGDATWVQRADVSDYGDYCTQCEQRVSVGSDYGLFMLPSGPKAPLELSTVRARVSLRDCVTLTPQSTAADGLAGPLLIDVASWQPPAANVSLRLPLAIVVATKVGLAKDVALLHDALETLQHIWAAAHVELEIEPSVTVDPPAGVLEYSATDHTVLIDLMRDARAALSERARDPRWPVMILGPCLRRHDVISGGQSQPWAYTPHLPGGSGVGDEPDQIFIATERCEGLSPLPSFDTSEHLGTVMAHELGHYLGLYHVKEADGRQDVLSDTDASDRNLMLATPSASANTLSQSQIDIARRHNAFAVSPHLQP